MFNLLNTLFTVYVSYIWKHTQRNPRRYLFYIGCLFSLITLNDTRNKGFNCGNLAAGGQDNAIT